jgi:hypothetical protein
MTNNAVWMIETALEAFNMTRIGRMNRIHIRNVCIALFLCGALQD